MVGNAEGYVCLKLIFVLIVSVLTLSFKVPEHGRCHSGVAYDLTDIVGNSVFVKELFGLYLSVCIRILEYERNTAYNYCLTVKDISDSFGSDVNIGKYLGVGLPMDDCTRTLFLALKLAFLKHACYGRTLLKGNMALDLAVIGVYLHEFRAVLCSTRTETVKTKGILVCGFAVVVVVLTARVKLTVNKVPVPSLFFFVISKRNASTVVIYCDGVVGVEDSEDLAAVSLSCLVNRV